jgi:putative ATPase
VYLALTPKSNALYKAYARAKEDAANTLSEGVPLHLRNAPTKLMGELGYGKDYQYAHDHKAKVTNMKCLPQSLENKTYYHPTDEGLEKRFKERLAYINNLKKKL